MKRSITDFVFALTAARLIGIGSFVALALAAPVEVQAANATVYQPITPTTVNRNSTASTSGMKTPNTGSASLFVGKQNVSSARQVQTPNPSMGTVRSSSGIRNIGASVGYMRQNSSRATSNHVSPNDLRVDNSNANGTSKIKDGQLNVQTGQMQAEANKADAAWVSSRTQLQNTKQEIKDILTIDQRLTPCGSSVC
jgi:hypothetical protein